MKKRILYFIGSLAFAFGMQAQVVNTFPHNEDFETVATCGTFCNATCPSINDYSNDPSAQQDWGADIGGTGSFNTGPTANGGADKNPGTSSGKYLYVETSGCSFQTAILNSPYIDMSTNPVNVSFWYHMFGASMGTMHFDVDTTKGQGTWIMDFIPSFTDNIDLWQEEVVDLSQFLGNDSVRFRFRFITGSSFTSDAALDDITIFIPPPVDFEALSLDGIETDCGLGSAETVGFSTLYLGSDNLFAGDSVFANYNMTVNGVTSSVREKITLNQNLVIGDTLAHTFAQTIDLSAHADYQFELYMEHPGDTINRSNDTLDELVISVPSVSSLPYTEDFENGTGGWRAEGMNPSWELGLPAKTNIIGANSGSNAWVVGGLTTQVNDIEQSWLVGPCFDLSTADSTTYIVAHIWWDAYEFGHAMRMEYSIDSGATWVVMGDDSDPNWYNRSFPSGFPSSSDGWTGRSSTNLSSNGYVSVFRPLDTALIGQSSALIRFYFGSSTTFNPNDGFAIDDVSIGTPDLADLGGDLMLCDGDNIDPALPANGTFRWFKDGVLRGINPTLPVGGIDTASSSIEVVLTYTDPIGVVSSDTIDVSVRSLPQATAMNVSDATCNGIADGAATINVNGGSGMFSYNWSTGDTVASVSNLAAGSYSVVVTDDSTGCTTSTMLTINEPTAVTIAIMNVVDASCNGNADGSAMASGSGGTGSYTYLWSNGDTAASITSLAAGTYTVTATDANGCTATNSATISEPAPISVMFNATNVTCNGGSDGLAVVSSAGGSMPYTYAWSNGGTGFVQSGLTQGTYTTTVTDANGCTAIDSVNISEPMVLAATVSSVSPTCNGDNNGSASLTTTGGTAPYSYIWSNGATTDSIGALVAGTYVATITDANNCSITAFATLTQPAAIDTSVSQFGFTLTSGQSGATYQWIDCAVDSIIPGETNQSFSAQRNGDFQVEITVNGCVDTSECITILGVGLESINSDKVDLSIYPNPTKDAFTIEVDKFNTYPLELYDVNGALVEIITLQSKKEVIDVSHLPSGIYHVRFGTSTKKLVITQ